MENRKDNPYDYFNYLYDELRLLDLLLLKELYKRQKKSVSDAGNSAFFIREEEVISLLNHSGSQAQDKSNNPDIKSIESLIEEVKSGIKNNLSNNKDAASNFPLMKLAGTFGLSPFEIQIIIMAFAAETDKKYEKIYAYFNNDITKKMPSVSTVLDILCDDKTEKLNVWRYFSPDSPLFYFDLINFVYDSGDFFFVSRRFGLDERIKRFIAKDNSLQENILDIARIYFPDNNLPVLAQQKSLVEKIIYMIIYRKNADNGRKVFCFFEKANEEKKAVVMAVCENIKVPLITADIEDIYLEPGRESIIKNLFREAVLHSAVIFFNNGDCLCGGDEKSKSFRAILLRAIRQLSWITLISAETLWIPEDNDGNYQWYSFEFKLPGYI